MSGSVYLNSIRPYSSASRTSSSGRCSKILIILKWKVESLDRRRVTVIQGDPAAAVMADEQQPGDLILDLLGDIPPALEIDRTSLLNNENLSYLNV